MGFKDFSKGLHLEVCRFLQTDEQYKLLELPRGHLKTSMCTLGYPLWRVIRHPDIRILLVSATHDNASKWIGMLSDIALYNELFRWLFPEILPDLKKVKWTAMALEFNRPSHFPEATIESIGVGGTAVSRHYDLMIKDDLVNEDHLINDEQMEKVINWHKTSPGLFVDPMKGEEVVVGNRWAFHDVIAYVRENQPYFKVYARAAIEDGQPIWPERFNLEGLDRILELQGPRIFSAQYMNNPVHENPRSFDKNWFRYFSGIPGAPMRKFTAVDPAIAQKRGDYTAIITVGMDPDHNIYVLDARRDRWGVDEMIDHMIEVQRIWEPVHMGIETVMFQKALLWPIREAMRRHHVLMNIKELRPSSKVTKEARISALHEYFANGSLFLRKEHVTLMKELVEFPLGAHDDMIDALAYAVQMALPASVEERKNNNPMLVANMLKDLKERQNPKSVWSWHGRESYATRSL